MMKRTIKAYSCSMAEWKQFINENPDVIFSLGSGEVWEDGDRIIQADDCEMACDEPGWKLTTYFGNPETKEI